MSDLEQAESEYNKAKEQIYKWSPLAKDSYFAKQQVDMWLEILSENSWCLPGSSQ